MHNKENIKQLNKGELIWATVTNNAVKNFMKLPKWKRTAAIDMDGVVFAPAGLINKRENVIFFNASFDGIRCVMDNGHLYFPTTWLAQEHPDWSAIMQAIENRMKRDFI